MQAAPEEHSGKSTSKDSVQMGHLADWALTESLPRRPSPGLATWRRPDPEVHSGICRLHLKGGLGPWHGNPRGGKEADVKAVPVDEIGAPRHRG